MTSEFSRSSRVLVGTVALITAVVLIRTAWLDDDAYITFRTVDNFLHGHGLRWNLADRVQTYTNPLWMFVMSAAAWVTHDVYYTSLALSIALTLAVVVLVVSRAAATGPVAIFASSVLLMSKSFIEYSTSGLENPLSHLLLVLLVLTPGWAASGGAEILGTSLVAALLLLNRLDMAVLVLPFLATSLWRAGALSRRHWWLVAIGFSPLVAWELFSLVYYGFPFPNTAYAKLGTGIPTADLLQQGALYLLDVINNDPVTPLVILAAILSPLVLGGDWAIPLGIAAYVAYVVSVGGDFMSGRMLAAPLLLSVLHLVRRPLPEIRFAPSLWLTGVAFVWLIGLTAPRPAILSDSTYGTDIDPLKILRPTGIMDERRWYYPQTGLLTVKPGTSHPDHKWLYMGYDLARRGQRFFLTDAAGFIGYAAGPTVHLLDWNALGDALLARLPAEVPWRVGHYRPALPDGYIETLQTGRNVIRDPEVAAYYDKLRIINAGAIWSLQRFRTIVAMNLGRYDSLLSNYGRVHVPLSAVSTPKPDGTQWNAGGNVVMTLRGAEIRLDAPRVARNIDISVSSNDTYRVLFMEKGREVDARTIDQPLLPDGSLRTHHVPAPGQPFDSILVIPSDGDYRYSLGSLVPSF